MKDSAGNAGWRPTRRGMLFGALSLSICPQLSAAAMHDPDAQFGQLNPHDPAELAQFAFLIGKWKCEAKIKSASGEWQTFSAAWLGRFILDGHVIADEYRMSGPSGDLIVLGMNFRSYDAAARTWNIKWLNALTGNWMDLVTPELGGLTSSGPSISYSFKEPTAGHPYTRATYTSHSTTHFTWRGDKSDDAKSWSEFMLVEAHREA